MKHLKYARLFLWLLLFVTDAKASDKQKNNENETSSETESSEQISMAVQGDTIVIGSSLPIESYAKMYGISIRDGLTMPITNVNDAGGINGKIIRLITLNDNYTPEMTRKNIEAFLNEYKTDIILSPYGDPTLETYLDLVKEKKILVLFPNTEVGIKLPYVIQFRSSYREQGTALTEYVINEKAAKKIAIIYHDDVWAREGKEGAQEVLKKSGFSESNYKFIPIERKVLTLKAQVDEIKEFNPDAIGFLHYQSPRGKFWTDCSLRILQKKHCSAWTLLLRHDLKIS